MATPEIASTYLAARQRIDDLVRPLPPEDLVRPVPVTASQTVRLGADDQEPVRRTTTDFEVLRARLGRRSRQQLVAMGWSSDPGALIDEIAVFPMSTADVDE